MNRIKISVITICLNAADDLKCTAESVLAQDYADFEYIIKDGGSTDDTGDLVEGYKEKLAAKGIEFKYVCESDGGIYDAMNRGAGHASGDYVIFMNAGDCFYDAHVLSAVADYASDKDKLPTIIYGDCAVYEYGRFFRFPKSIDKIERAMPFSHQSCFAKTEFVKAHPFDTSLKFCADYDFLLTAHDLGEEFADAGITVCITTADGVSSLRYHDTMMETQLVIKNHGKQVLSEDELARKEKELRVKQFVLDKFPVFVRKMIRSYQIKTRGQSFDALTPEWFKH